MSTTTEVYYIIDESGSMNNLKLDVVGSFNSYVEDQQDLEVDDDCYLSLMTFDTTVDIVLNGLNVNDIEELDDEDYSPGGRTALYDAIGKAFEMAGGRLGRDEEPDNVMFAVMTDGEENSSTEYKLDEISDKIDKYQEEEGWEFLFTGVDIDEWAQASKMNFQSKRTVGVDQSSDGIGKTFNAMNVANTSLRADGQVDEQAMAQYTDSTSDDEDNDLTDDMNEMGEVEVVEAKSLESNS